MSLVDGKENEKEKEKENEKERFVLLHALQTRYSKQWLKNKSLGALRDLMYGEMLLDRLESESDSENESYRGRDRDIVFPVADIRKGGVKKPEIHLLFQRSNDWSRPGELTSDSERELVITSQHNILLYLQNLKKERKERLVLFPERVYESMTADQRVEMEPNDAKSTRDTFPNGVPYTLTNLQKVFIETYTATSLAVYLGLVDYVHKSISEDDNDRISRALRQGRGRSSATLRLSTSDQLNELLAREIKAFVEVGEQKSIICVTAGYSRKKRLPYTLAKHNLPLSRDIDTAKGFGIASSGIASSGIASSLQPRRNAYSRPQKVPKPPQAMDTSNDLLDSKTETTPKPKPTTSENEKDNRKLSTPDDQKSIMPSVPTKEKQSNASRFNMR